MNLLDDLYHFAKNRLIYMTGRGVIGLGMMTGGVLLGLGSAVPASVALGIVGVTAGLQSLITYREQRFNEDKLVNFYRDEVATTLGIDPESVSIDQLKLVAKGSYNRGVEEHPTIEQALTRIREQHMMNFITTGFAGLATASVLMVGQIGNAVGEFLSGIYDVTPLDGTFFDPGNATAVAGTMFVSGTGMGMLNKLFDRIGARITGLDKPTAHEQILTISKEIGKGKSISRQQVFGVVVSANRMLDNSIEERFGEHYARLSDSEKAQALQEYGHKYPLEQWTKDINNRQIKPQELAYAAVGQASGIARNPVPNPPMPQERKTDLQAITEQVAKELNGDNQKEGLSEPQPFTQQQQQRPEERVFSYVDYVTGGHGGKAAEQLYNTAKKPLTHAERLASRSLRELDNLADVQR